MSEIFNIVLIKPNQPPLIYTFNDAKSKSLKKKQIPQLIYGDDTIQRIKEKIHIYTDLNLPLSEMYLFKRIPVLSSELVCFGLLAADFLRSLLNCFLLSEELVANLGFSDDFLTGLSVLSDLLSDLNDFFSRGLLFLSACRPLDEFFEFIIKF